MTPEQQRAIAIAKARRLRAEASNAEPTDAPTTDDKPTALQRMGEGAKALSVLSQAGMEELVKRIPVIGEWTAEQINELDQWLNEKTGGVIGRERPPIEDVKPEMFSKPEVQAAIGASRSLQTLTPGVDPQRTKQALKEVTGKEPSGFYEAGKLIDPIPWMIGAQAARMMPYQKLTGGGFGQGALNMVKNVGAGGLTGAGIAAVSPDIDVEEGAAFGAGGAAVLPPLIGASGKLLQTGKNIVAPIFSDDAARMAGAHAARRVAGDKADEIADALMQARRGETAGQAAVPTGSAEFAALQKMAGESRPTVQKAIEGAQAGKRARVLSNVTPGFDEAVAARKSATAPIREEALASAVVPIKASSLSSKVDDAFGGLGELGKSDVQAVRKYIKSRLSEMADDSGNINPETLYGFRTSLGSDIGKLLASADPSKSPSKKFMAGLQRKAQTYIDDAIEESGGTGWRNYLSEYQRLSKPVEQAPILGEMKSTLEGIGKEQGAPFLRKLKGEDAFVKKGTTYGKQELKDILTPRQQKVVAAIAKQLERDIKQADLASAGMKETQYKLKGSFEPYQPVQMLDRAMMLINAAMARAQGAGGKKAMRELAVMMQENPRLLGQMMKDAGAPKASKVIEAMMAKQAPVGVISAGE